LIHNLFYTMALKRFVDNRTASLQPLLGFLTDSHRAGEGVLPFLCESTKDATKYRDVCKELTHSIACFPWKKGPDIKRRFSSWHACFPRAVTCSLVTDNLKAEDAIFFKHVVEFNLVSSFAFVASESSLPFLGRARFITLNFSASIKDGAEEVCYTRAASILAEHCSNLQMLKIEQCTDDMLLSLQNCPKLNNLWLDDYDEHLISSEGLAQFGRSMHIQSLTIPFLTDAVCLAIADNFPALTSFSTFCIEDVSEDSLVRLVKNCPCLFRLWVESGDVLISTNELLTALSRHAKITDVWMSDTPVADKGVLALLQSKSLRHLVLTHYEGALGDACKAALLKRFPLCFN
jgi:hypothetical protein